MLFHGRGTSEHDLFPLLDMLDPEQRPKEMSGKMRALLKGYPFALGLSITMILLLLFVPLLRKRRSPSPLAPRPLDQPSRGR